jgi:glycosyltransferase involved in cell wall biosynthesis
MEAEMRIGFISSFPPIECGIATYSQYLTGALREKGADVYIVCHKGGSGEKVFPAFDYEDGDIAEKAFQMMTRFTPDVVHIQHEFGLFGKHSGVSVLPLITQFRLDRIPVVTTLHTVYREIPREHRILMESIAANSDRIIVHESYQAEALKKILRQEEFGKIKVVPHGAREVTPVSNAKKILSLPDDKKVILIIGYFRPSKNFELIVDIFPEIVKRYQDVILVVAGKIRGTEHRGYRNMLFSKIAQSPVKDKIFILRGQLPQETFDTILSAADAVALPYKITSQSGILAHCLAFGKPVVSSNTEVMQDTIGSHQAGIVCETERDYIDGICRILSEPDFASRLSQNARNYVRNEIAWSHIADQHIRLYREIMDIPHIDSHIILVE